MTRTLHAVCTPLRLERLLQPYQISPEPLEHVLDHVIRPNAKNVVSNFSRHMPVPQMPGHGRELIEIRVADLDDQLRGRLDPQPRPVFKLQTISMSHGHCLRKVEKDLTPLIRGQANTAAMPLIEIESDGANRFLFRPVTGRMMRHGAMHRHLST